MRTALLAVLTLLATTTACSASDEDAAPPVTADERRALAEAREMIPGDELPATATPTATTAAGEGGQP
ncbi:MAG: hypothetical protein JNJ92_04540 [Altererythrobacter sp.]|nr:hypothetical protein [Altererythrobacter sp.]